MAKHEQILVLDPPSDLKFKGKPARTRPSGDRGGRASERAGGGAAAAARPDGPRSPPPCLASEPRPRCVPRPRASLPAAARPGLRRGGEGASQPGGRRGGLSPAPPPPSCGPRGRRGSPPAPGSPARSPACPLAPPAGPARCPCPRGGRSALRALREVAGGWSFGPRGTARRGGVCGRQRAAVGGRGRGAQDRVGRSRASPGVSPCQVRGSGEPGGPAVSWLGVTPGVGRAPRARQKAVRQLGGWMVVGEWWWGPRVRRTWCLLPAPGIALSFC